MKKGKNWIGYKFNQLTIVGLQWNCKAKRNYFLVKCECGNTKVLHPACLNNRTVSCGCAQRKNKLTGPKRHRYLSKVWYSMISRCYNDKNQAYGSYGAKGVIVCDEWRNDYYLFEKWALSNGYVRGLELDKDIKGNSKLYSPQTCLWVSKRKNIMDMMRRKLIRKVKEKGVIRREKREAENKRVNSSAYKAKYFTF